MIKTASLLLLSAAAASASVTAYNVPAGQAGNQAFGGSLGMDFNVVSAPGITVDRIGVFDSNSDGLGNAINAYIYDRTTGLPVPGSAMTFAAGATGTLEGGSRFLNLASPVTLPAGFQGSIVAEGYSGAELNGNAGPGAPPWTTDRGTAKLTFVGSSRWGNPGSFPSNPDGGGANRYAAGTFSFDAAPSVGSTWSAMSRPAPVPGVQNFGGSLGIDFVVNSGGAVLRSLGAFDSNADGILSAGGITTQLWQRNNNGTPNDPTDDTGTLITSDTFSAAVPGTLEGSYRFKDLASPLSLAAGDYTIVAFGYDAAELNGNIFSPDNVPYSDEGNGTISFVGRSRYGAPGAFPDSPDTLPVQYMGPSFKFSAVPEPGTAAFGGLLAAALLRRRNR